MKLTTAERAELVTAYTNLINARSAVIGQLRREGKATDAARLQHFNTKDNSVLISLKAGLVTHKTANHDT